MFYNDAGKLLNPDFTDYKISTSVDVPEGEHFFYEETPEELSPYGNRGIGEHSMIAPSPAICNALFDAIGVRVHSYPLHRERVYKAIQAGKRGEKDLWGYEFAPGQSYEDALKLKS